MAFKLIVLAAFVAYANAGAIGAVPGIAYSGGAELAYSGAAQVDYAAPVAAVAKTIVADDSYDPHPQYSYAYDVHDAITGDVKSQKEERDGDVVRGSYSLLEADGTRRIVEYTADPHSGFNAVVHKEPANVAVAAPIVKTAVAAAPVAVAAHGYEGHGYEGHGYEGHGYEGHGYEGHGYEGHGYEGHGYY